MTRAIILSGGWGTRLRPLTCTIPKTLIPVLNTPIIEREILMLKEIGVEEIVLAVSVMGKDLKKYFKNGEKLGVKIDYTNEQSPMGTAGALKLAEPLLNDDNFFMLNGDVILNFDFQDLLKTHEKYGGTGTIASRSVKDPSRYGVLIIDEKTQKIERFLEKDEYHPDKNNKESMPVNAGVYVLEPEIFSFIPPRKKISIEKDTFPKVAQEGGLYHYPISGIWKDIGKPPELLKGNILLMKDVLKKSDRHEENLIKDSADIHPSVKIIPPICIGEKAIINKNCTIGPNVVIGDNVYIEKNCKISNTLIYQEAYFSRNSTIKWAIISDNCHIRKNVRVEGNKQNLVILASYVEIKEGIELISPASHAISICHHEKVRENITF
jgi:mannose-1-phosphate guanylyltransferase